MYVLGWVFWSLNLIVVVCCIFHYIRYYGRNGQWGLIHPAGGVLWIWHGIGVALTAYLAWSPWHLLWWFPVGFVMCVVVGRLLKVQPL